jgi:hypothetical protein
MTGRKNFISGYQNIVSESMGSDVTSSATNIEGLDNVGIYIDFSGTPVGTFAVQVSTDKGPPTRWSDLELSPDPVASGSADTITMDLNNLPYSWLRLVYRRTSGTGTLSAWISAKAV